MIVEIGTETAQFLLWEYINRNLFAAHLNIELVILKVRLSFRLFYAFLFRNGLIYFPDFCQVVLKRYRQDKDAEENFMQNMFKVKKTKFFERLSL
jgi:hypothetical protein